LIVGLTLRPHEFLPRVETVPFAAPGCLSVSRVSGSFGRPLPGRLRLGESSISSLFQPLSLTGTRNAARPLAVFAILLFSVGVALVFHQISKRGETRFHRKTIQIAGTRCPVWSESRLSESEGELCRTTSIDRNERVFGVRMQKSDSFFIESRSHRRSVVIMRIT
jgi:hypothetical protein